MCQIIALKTTKKKFKRIKKNQDIVTMLQKHLEKKGGDYLAAGFIIEENSFKIESKSNLVILFDEIYKKIKDFDNNCLLQILLFSRQQPEMEVDVSQEQPYFSDIANDWSLSAIHGTIHNDKELAQEYNVNINVDTEIFKYLKLNEWHKAEGTYSAIRIDKAGFILVQENGLKVWKYHLVDRKAGEIKHLAEVVTTGEMSELEAYVINWAHKPDYKETLFVAFSGGMDISLSTFKELANNPYKKLVLNYFAWGSKAEEMELLSLEKLKDFYSSNFPNIDVEIIVWEAEKYFNEYFKLNEAPLPKISVHNSEAKADSAETESPLSYVPYRNTQFSILLASKAEAMGLQHVNFLFGLNLSEGMVFMDNSEGWLQSINNVIKYGGKDHKITGDYDVIAPYYPRTKTNMLKEFKEEFGLDILEQLLSLSKSCYYPKEDGTSCGECGSCILRNKALEKLKGE
jgi:7-cyano-7-deazaguanine synthase in queuosine biosynthesis